MTDDAPTSSAPINRGHQPLIANDGHQPRPTPWPSVAPGKVQGGYQAPAGGKPPVPTTGSGVKK
jgi:hypothetical protein